ncbi:ATP-binding cassette domain-containing protein [Rhizobium sp. Leaf321]|jgi:capsular polysaccharide transport system ATP-binding protein|uniref:ATP-binding cassette domain-containing protein n=1 Tax=Rhizobium sp. Leaf321 TaxID=1736335 RepID=UPI0009EC769D|nr:ATP-binding cassette domain-containing protein [Rhizobium sp. Leaf321]
MDRQFTGTGTSNPVFASLPILDWNSDLLFKNLFARKDEIPTPAVVGRGNVRLVHDSDASRSGSQIVLSGVSQYVGMGARKTLVLKDINATFEKGRYVGILADRGAGKTTFANLLTGNLRPDVGDIHHGLRVSWPIGARQILSNAASLRANIRFLSQVYQCDFRYLLEETRDFASIPATMIDRSLSEISSEIGNRAATALVLFMPFDILVADDTIMLGNASFRLKAMQRLKDLRGSRGLVAITRNVSVVRELCDDCMVLSNGTLVDYKNRGDAIRAFKVKATADDDEDDDRSNETNSDY